MAPARMTNAPMALPQDLPPIAPAVLGGDAQALFKSAYDALNNGDPSASAEQFARGLDIDPSDGLAHYYLGVAYERLGRADYAAIQYRRVADGWPNTDHGVRAASRMNAMVNGFAPRPVIAQADRSLVRPIRKRRPRVRTIEEIFKGSEGAEIMASIKRAEKRKARDARRAKAVAAQPARNPALVRVAAKWHCCNWWPHTCSWAICWVWRLRHRSRRHIRRPACSTLYAAAGTGRSTCSAAAARGRAARIGTATGNVGCSAATTCSAARGKCGCWRATALAAAAWRACCTSDGGP